MLLAFMGVIMWLIAVHAPDLALVIPARNILVAVISLMGMALILAGAVAFSMAGTTVNPMQPTKTSSVVTRGVYTISRNPMYVGFLLILLSWALLLSNMLSFAILPAFIWYMNRFQIIPEEQALRAKFGGEYAVYTKRVRRWL